MPRPPFGYCPHCQTAGVREMNGVITCSNGHSYTPEQALNSVDRGGEASPSAPAIEYPEHIRKRAGSWGAPDGESPVDLGQNIPQQPAATPVAPVAPPLQQPLPPTAGTINQGLNLIPVPPPVGRGDGLSFVEYAQAVEDRQDKLEQNIRLLVGFLAGALNEFQGYLPENQVVSSPKQGENSQKEEKTDSQPTPMEGGGELSEEDLESAMEQFQEAGVLPAKKQAETEESREEPSEDGQDPVESESPERIDGVDAPSEGEDEGQNGPPPPENLTESGKP